MNTQFSTTGISDVFDIYSDKGAFNISLESSSSGAKLTHQIRSLYRREDFNRETRTFKVPQLEFIEDKISYSLHKTIKGFHGDFKTWKLIQCLKGSVQLVVLDNRKESSTYGKLEYFVLNDVNGKQVLVPPGVGNAHLCVTTDCIFHYKQTEYYTSPADQFSINPLSENLDIQWNLPREEPILSERDKNAPDF